jgi:hypothetical protein
MGTSSSVEEKAEVEGEEVNLDMSSRVKNGSEYDFIRIEELGTSGMLAIGVIVLVVGCCVFRKKLRRCFRGKGANNKASAPPFHPPPNQDFSLVQYNPHQSQLYQGPVAPVHSYPYTAPMQPGAGIPCHSQFNYWEQMAAAQLARKKAVQEEMMLMSGGHGMMGQASCSGNGHSAIAGARQVQGPGTVVRQSGQTEGGPIGVYTQPGSQREIEAGLAASIGSS